MKKTLIITVIIVVAYFVIGAIKGTLNPLKWFAAGSNQRTNLNQRTATGSVFADPLLRCNHDLNCYKNYTEQLMNSVNQNATLGITNYPISVLQDRHTYLVKCLNN